MTRSPLTTPHSRLGRFHASRSLHATSRSILRRRAENTGRERDRTWSDWNLTGWKTKDWTLTDRLRRFLKTFVVFQLMAVELGVKKRVAFECGRDVKASSVVKRITCTVFMSNILSVCARLHLLPGVRRNNAVVFLPRDAAMLARSWQS